MDNEKQTHKYIAVPHQYIEVKHPTRFLKKPPSISQDNIQTVMATNLDSLVNNGIIAVETVSPTERLALAIKHAKDYINRLRLLANLSPINPELMKTALLEKERYDEVYRIIFRKSADFTVNALGFVSTSTEQAVVPVMNFQDSLVGAFMTHELIHKFLEIRVDVYNIQRDAEGNETVYSNPRRLGLGVKHLPPHRLRMVDEVLNELPNYYYQFAYMRDLFQQYPHEFQGEKAERDELLHRHFQISDEEEATLACTTYNSDNVKKEFALNSKFVHFDKDGNILINTMSGTIGLAQLAYDINELCSEVNGEPFMQLLLRGKINPHLLPQIKQVMDNKIGVGFFSRLREMDYNSPDEYLDLLVDIQSLK